MERQGLSECNTLLGGRRQTLQRPTSGYMAVNHTPPMTSDLVQPYTAIEVLLSCVSFCAVPDPNTDVLKDFTSNIQ